jgi:hypothetical protein
MKALGLLSGGLDSTLAVRIILDQGIEVVALKFTSPFCQCDSGGCCHAARVAQEMGIELITRQKGQEFLDIVRSPPHGRGSGMNPCLDCRIFMLRKSAEIAKEIGASFIFTGEVLGQRPMSQLRHSMELVERESGLQGKLLRPLSARLLPPTEAELNGWVDREKLLSISGRRRKEQMQLAAIKGINDYPCPAGGCLLTSKEFSLRLVDHLQYEPDSLTAEDVALLKLGRHFRVEGCKVIIGRNERENMQLRGRARSCHSILEPESVPGPTCLVQTKDLDEIMLAAALVARYSDNEGKPVEMRALRLGREDTFMARPMQAEEVAAWRIGAE